MKIRYFIWLYLTAISFQALPAIEAQELKLVQSVPLETDLTIASDALSTKDAWIEMIRNATKSIDISQFYIADKLGEALESVIQELENAGARGVKIRMLVESKIANDISARPLLDRIKKIKGLTFHDLNYVEAAHGTLHAKYWIIDSQTIYIGSADFDWQSLTENYETGLLIHDPVVAKEIGDIFAMDWGLATSSTLPRISATTETGSKNAPATTQGKQQTARIEVVASPPSQLPEGIKWNEKAILDQINGAKATIKIMLHNYSTIDPFANGVMSPHFWPDIDNALRAAALIRGVAVNIIVADKEMNSSINLAILKSLAAIPKITIKMVHIPPSSKGPIPMGRYLGSRWMTIDGKVLWLGSTQWTGSSFDNSRNVDVIVSDEDFTGKVEETFQTLWNSTYARNVIEVKPS